MIEVVFSDSTKGSMKVAKNYKKENMIGGTIGYIGTPSNKNELGESFEDKALGGTSDEVVGISLYLDIGDIEGGVTCKERKNLIFKMFRNPMEFYPEEEKEITEYWDNNLTDLEKLHEYAENGEHIRIWYSDAPYSICGFYCINYILKEYNNKVTAIKLPKYQIQKNGTIVCISYSSWCEIAPGEFTRFLSLEREITPIEKRFIASKWQKLQIENAPYVQL